MKSRAERVGLALLMVLAACANRSEARVRRAWTQSPSDARGPTANEGEVGEAVSDGEAPVAPPKQGWARVDELLERSVEVLVTAPSPDVLGQLATKWCEVAPIPRETDHGSVSVCYLHPPVRVQGVALTLELSDTGVIGFVAPDLSNPKSAEVAAEARAAVQRHCEGPWTNVPDAELQTCELSGGSTLAVGRLKQGGEDAPWQVSIAVLGAI
ncbi:MAG: hypothetical protein AAGA54_23575 [Myxococcota bacterium]